MHTEWVENVGAIGAGEFGVVAKGEVRVVGVQLGDREHRCHVVEARLTELVLEDYHRRRHYHGPRSDILQGQCQAPSYSRIRLAVRINCAGQHTQLVINLLHILDIKVLTGVRDELHGNGIAAAIIPIDGLVVAELCAFVHCDGAFTKTQGAPVHGSIVVAEDTGLCNVEITMLMRAAVEDGAPLSAN